MNTGVLTQQEKWPYKSIVTPVWSFFIAEKENDHNHFLSKDQANRLAFAATHSILLAWAGFQTVDCFSHGTDAGTKRENGIADGFDYTVFLRDW